SELRARPFVRTLKSCSLNVLKLWGPIMVPGGITNFLGVPKSSVRNQPLISAGLAVGLLSSITSTWPGTTLVSVCVKASLMTTGGRGGAEGSFWPGEPPTPVLGRQPPALFQLPKGPFSSRGTRAKPVPSVTRYHLSL